MHFLLLLTHFFILPFQFTGKSPVVTPALHPFYVTVTEITQNSKDKSLEVSCKFFADDFEETLQGAYKKPLDITAENERALFDKLIPDYIGKHLAMAADGKLVKLLYVGFEKDKEAVYCYFEVPNFTTAKSLEMHNTLLHDFKNEQINIMHVTVGGKRQSIKLDYPSNKASFRF